jgi:hypothetical protein
MLFLEHSSFAECVLGELAGCFASDCDMLPVSPAISGVTFTCYLTDVALIS